MRRNTIRLWGAVIVLLVCAGSAAAQPRVTGAEFAAQPRNYNPGGLPPVQSNVDLVGKLGFAGHDFGDVAVYRGFGYLNAWAETDRCRGGTYVADLSNPAQPQQLGFLPAAPETYHGEGAHVITITTPSFSGDILAVNNEPCSAAGEGGLDIWDITDPRSPVLLTQGFGDFGGEGSLTRGPGDDDVANSSHSVFLWQGGSRAYAVIVDNEEAHDVDIIDITNPRSPTPVGEFELFAFGVADGQPPYLPLAFTRDVVVKNVNGVQTMLVGYWDAGYVALNVDDPANPQLIADSDFPTTDPRTGLRPEGNAHSADFSWDGKYLLGADEDFAPFRAGDLQVTTGAGAGTYPASELPFGGLSVGSLPDHTVNGPTVFGGYGCPDVPDRDTVFPTPLPADEEATIVVLPGSCETADQIENAEAAGYDAVIVVSFFSFPFCFGAPADVDLASLCTTNAVVQPLFGSTTPPIGDIGETITDSAVFDGWGYMHLYRNGAGTLQEVESDAIPEALDAQYAYGFGDLSIHKLATDPTENFAYASYYSGGLRVFSFGDGGLTQVGAFVESPETYFSGIHQFTTPGGQRLIAGSDRDYGLFIFRYTGPGAAQPPVCNDTDNTVPYKTTGQVSLRCSDANSNPLTRSIVTPPGRGTVGAINQAQGTVDFTDTGDRIGATSLTYKANDGAADSATATARISIVAREGGACFNPHYGFGLLEGSAFGDRLEGGSGNDRLVGLGGVDCLFGLLGDDSLLGGAHADQQFGGNGNDLVSGEAGNDTLAGELGNDRVRGGGGADRLLGGPGADNMNGGTGRDRLAGGSGNDRIEARDGSVDTIDCGQGRDRVVSADRTDRIARNCEQKPRFKQSKKKKHKKKSKKKRR